MNWFIGMFVGFLGGCLLTFIYLNNKRTSVPLRNTNRSRVMENAVNMRLAQGPQLATIGGGTGLSTLLGGLKGFTRNITAVVAVTDEGGSSGRLRQEWGVLPPGDVRNCIVALAENDNSLNRILNFRFDRGELKGHNLGNLILLAVSELVGDFQRAVEELNRLLAIRGRVLPVTNQTVVLHGETVDNIQLRGELDISDHGSRLRKIWLEPKSAQALPEVLEAIYNADLVVLGPGSLFTSILPNLLIEQVVEAVKASSAPKVYIANLMTQPKETEGMNIVAHIDWIASVLGKMPEYLVTNQAPIPDIFLEHYREKGAEPLYLSKEEEQYLESHGTRVVYGDLVNFIGERYLRHHSQRLAEIIINIARETREELFWKD